MFNANLARQAEAVRADEEERACGEGDSAKAAAAERRERLVESYYARVDEWMSTAPVPDEGECPRHCKGLRGLRGTV